ncbi:MAG: pantoate--beta-alanine ligase [Gemmobacter sp.]
MTPVLRRVTDLRGVVAGWKAAGQVVGVVPTMGALHEGHLSLVRAARAACGRVIVTIFVNPRQFDNPADLAKYPRTEDTDAGLLATVGVDAIFAPPPDEVYPDGFATRVTVAGLSDPLEGTHRPGHFDGVATVVAKLFGMTQADHAFFGQKDWQQLAVVRRLAADLNLPVTIHGCETLRDADGLALSSRNARLTPPARSVAPALHRAMQGAAQAIRDGQPAESALAIARTALLTAGFDRIDYLSLADPATMTPVVGAPARLLAAAWLDGVRLIDNIPV